MDLAFVVVVFFLFISLYLSQYNGLILYSVKCAHNIEDIRYKKINKDSIFQGTHTSGFSNLGLIKKKKHSTCNTFDF